MAYVPNNTSIYLRASAGFIGGIVSSATDTAPGDYTLYSKMADAYGQAVDIAFGASAPTNYELTAIQEVSEAIWALRSPLNAIDGVLAGSYTQIAQAVVARVLQGNAQVVAEGIDPNAIGGGGGGGGGSGITAADGADLTGLSITGFTVGTLAYVQTFMTREEGETLLRNVIFPALQKIRRPGGPTFGYEIVPAD